MITPQQAASKLANGIRNGTTAYSDGVNAVQVAPSSQAIAKKSKWVQAMTDPRTHDRWEAGLSRISLLDWKNATSGIGAQRFAQSADKAQSNYQEFANDFFPFLEQGQQQVNSMPDVTLDERINKAVAMMRYTSQYQRP